MIPMQFLENPDFNEAVNDLIFLRSKGYPRRTAYQLVSNRYALNRIQRIMLYRGIYPEQEALQRKGRKILNGDGEILWIDSLNVVFILANYLTGRPVFICMDGILRDAGEAFPKPEDEVLLSRTVLLLQKYLPLSGFGEIHFVLDSPGIITERLQSILKQHSTFVVHPVTKADSFLKKAEKGVIATSDSEIIDSLSLPYIDLPQWILKAEYNAEFISFNRQNP